MSLWSNCKLHQVHLCSMEPFDFVIIVSFFSIVGLVFINYLLYYFNICKLSCSTWGTYIRLNNGSGNYKEDYYELDDTPTLQSFACCQVYYHKTNETAIFFKNSKLMLYKDSGKQSNFHLKCSCLFYDYLISPKNEKCPICLNLFTSLERILYLRCEHAFHEDCISKWLLISTDYKNYSKCPMCMTSVEVEEVISDRTKDNQNVREIDLHRSPLTIHRTLPI